MATYSRFVDLAVKLISKWGAPVAIRREENVLNPDDGSINEAPILEQTVQGIFVPNQWGQNKTSTFAEGQAILTNDRQMIVTAKSYDFTPEPGDQVILGNGNSYDIVALIPIDPGSIVIVYKLLLRR